MNIYRLLQIALIVLLPSIASSDGEQSIVSMDYVTSYAVIQSSGQELNIKKLIDSAPPLIKAVLYGDESKIRDLVEGGADINQSLSDGTSGLMLSAYVPGTTTMQLLIELNASINNTNLNGESALSIAAGNGHRLQVEMLLKSGAKSNVPTNNISSSALYRAILSGNLSIVKLLVNYGVDTHIEIYDLGPTEFAKKLKYYDIADYLTMVSNEQLNKQQ